MAFLAFIVFLTVGLFLAFVAFFWLFEVSASLFYHSRTYFYLELEVCEL